jgi:hypothetical protein
VKYLPPPAGGVNNPPPTNRVTKTGRGPDIIPDFGKGTGGPISPGDPPLGSVPLAPVDNTLQQEITLDGVVTGTDGFAVLTVREPGSQNTAVPETKRYVRLGEEVTAGEKIVAITEDGLRLSKTRGIWRVGTKRGVSQRGTMLALLPTASGVNPSALEVRLPPTQTPR